MFEYKVETYKINKCIQFVAATVAQDAEIEDYLKKKELEGWQLVTFAYQITENNISYYKVIFRKEK